MISELDILIRLGVAAALGAIIGLEREKSGQPAGLRTHIILVIGAALAMMLSVNVALQYKDVANNGDPGRIAAQIVSGIGFLGAGAIMRYGTAVKGLTTATSLWTMAVVGMSVGLGYYIVSITATVLLFIVLFLLNKIEHHFIIPGVLLVLVLTADDKNDFVERLRTAISTHGRRIDTFTIQKNIRHKRLKIEVSVHAKGVNPMQHLMEDLSEVSGVREFKIS
jgi:putative Mg2+ transporter-C (MgtC) family protein